VKDAADDADDAKDAVKDVFRKKDG